MKFLKYIIVTALLISFISCTTSSEPQMYEVEISVNPSAEGTIHPSADSLYEEGSVITFRANGSEAYAFSEWTGDVSSSKNPLQLTVDKNYNITAGFARKQYDLTVDKTGDGTVQETVVQAKTYEHGAVVELRATPETGYEFKDWSGDLNSTDNPKTLVMDGPKTVTANFQVNPTKAAVKINIDWTSLDQSLNKAKYKGISDSVTHFGARLVYPAQNAVFIQSVEKVTADSLGIITMEVPSADTARLLVTAVRYENGNHKVFGMGVLEDITIDNGTAYDWSVEDISWTKPTWKVADSLATDYGNGTFTVSKEKTYFDLWYLVKTPYITDPLANYEQLIIKLNGTGGEESYENGYREFRAVAENPTPGTANQQSYSFFPWLDSDKFNLPSARYVVEKKGNFTVYWE
ncbi:MAG TPA: hypothetical protein VJ905_07050 [Halalkalibaculum sp.]|nr:hypothetical protein [Halalkalibaculum sp.]